MKIDRIYMPVETLGPGKRIVVWTRGCTKGCSGCANPELWDNDSGIDIESEKLVTILVQMAERSGIDRITFTGGDPLEQYKSLIDLLRKIRCCFRDILIYTGFTIDELKKIINSDELNELKKLADALIDGPYIKELNDGKCSLRGSTNQMLHIFNEHLRSDYDRALKEPRKVQNAVFDGRSISIGIHGKRANYQ